MQAVIFFSLYFYIHHDKHLFYVRPPLHKGFILSILFLSFFFFLVMMMLITVILNLLQFFILLNINIWSDESTLALI